MAAIPELYATITSVNDPEVGWYQAEININPGFIVSGTSLKGSTFTVGEKVRIFQFLFWGSGAEFGFAKESEMDYSVCQFNQAFFEGVRNQNPHGFLLNWIAQKANNKKQMFGAGKIHSFITYPGIGNIGARVDLVSSSTRAILGFAADLNPNEFNLDDGVLVSYWPNPGRTIEGWWQTVPESAGIINFVALGSLVSLSAEKSNSFGVQASITISSGASNNIAVGAGDEVYSGLPTSTATAIIADTTTVTAGGAVIPPTAQGSFNFEVGRTYKLYLTWALPSGVTIESTNAKVVSPETSLNYRQVKLGGETIAIETYITVTA